MPDHRLSSLPGLLVFLAGLIPFAGAGREGHPNPERAAHTIILDDKAVENLGIETVEVAEGDFEESFFAIGRIEEIPQNHAVLSSRIAGSISALSAYEGDTVKEGDDLIQVRSRLPGDPPPKLWLKAPISGIVVRSHVSLGEPVDPDREMLDILDLSEVWATARVPERLTPELTPGQTRAYLRVPALGEATFTGTLLRFGTVADIKSGTVDAIFQIPNQELRMRPGMRVEFNIVTGVRKNVLAVPRAAIQGNATDRAVYVRRMDKDLPNVFERTPVQLGRQNDRYAEVVSGLFPFGEEVVTTGSYLLGFAGSGNISLQEALDIAHGHKHDKEGNPIAETPNTGNKGGRFVMEPLTRFLGIACGVLLLLLILSLFLPHPDAASRSPSAGA